jgi:hypothetical protein
MTENKEHDKLFADLFTEEHVKSSSETFKAAEQLLLSVAKQRRLLRQPSHIFLHPRPIE